MRKNYGRSLLLTSSVLIGAVSLPLLISCGAESHEGDKQTETGGGTGVTQAATVAVTEVGTQPTATETSTGEEATGLEKLVTLYKELGKGLVEQEDVTKKVEALSRVVDHVNKLGESYKEFTKAQVEVKALKSQVRFAKSELDLAQDNNYRLGKEIMLYLLGFKLI